MSHGKSDTTMKEAFARAGVKSADERLTDIAIKAMIAHADNSAETLDAIWAEVQESRQLMAALFVHSWRREVSALLERTRRLISNKETAGTLSRPLERKAAAALQTIRAEETRQAVEDAASNARSIAAYQAEQERETQKWLAKWRATPIGGLVIREKPVWQCSAGTVRAWLETEKRRWRAVELLIEGLPDDGRPIEYYRKPEEVAAIWAITD
jgi:hypothetical protein